MDELDLYKQALADNVRAYRCSLGMSQAALSEASGLSRSSIVALEQGVGNPSFESLFRLASVFHVRVEELISNNELGVE